MKKWVTVNQSDITRNYPRKELAAKLGVTEESLKNYVKFSRLPRNIFEKHKDIFGESFEAKYNNQLHINKMQKEVIKQLKKEIETLNNTILILKWPTSQVFKNF